VVLGGGIPPKVVALIEEKIQTAGPTSYWKRRAADAYIGWVAYYVRAFASADAISQCHLTSIKDGTLKWNVRNRFSEIHDYVNSDPKANKKV